MATPHVLIVEDDPDSRELFSLVLQYAGAQVTVAADGSAGLVSAMERPPDVVITDLAMPRMDGFEMTRRLRAVDTTKHTPIVALSGQGDEALRRSRLVGCNAVLSKPCMPEELITALLPFVGGSRRRLRRQSPVWCGAGLDRRNGDRRRSFPRGAC